MNFSSLFCSECKCILYFATIYTNVRICNFSYLKKTGYIYVKNAKQIIRSAWTWVTQETPNKKPVLCLSLFVLHRHMGTRRLYSPSRGIKHILICFMSLLSRYIQQLSQWFLLQYVITMITLPPYMCQ